MAERAARAKKNGVDRFQAAFQSIDEEVQRLQKRFRSRRRTLEKRTQKQFDRLFGELRKIPVVKRADSLRADAAKQLGNGIGSVLGVFRIASKTDIDRIDRRLSQLNRKLREFEKLRGSARSGAGAGARASGQAGGQFTTSSL